MSWQHLETARHADAILDLYRDAAGHFMIRANGLELMSSRAHTSEDVLGAMAAERAAGDNPCILIGGLGLGFTLETVIRLKPAAHITVAEISADVIAWYRRIVAPARGIALSAAVTIAHADVHDLLTPAAFDCIALDVDNGPEAFTTAGNGTLYAAAGLALLRVALLPGGTGLVWSGFESQGFAARAAAAGFSVACTPIAVPHNPRLTHYVYALARR